MSWFLLYVIGFNFVGFWLGSLFERQLFSVRHKTQLCSSMVVSCVMTCRCYTYIAIVWYIVQDRIFLRFVNKNFVFWRVKSWCHEVESSGRRHVPTYHEQSCRRPLQHVTSCKLYLHRGYMIHQKIY